MTKLAASVLKKRVFLRAKPLTMTIKIPNKYIEGPIQEFSGNKAAANKANRGSLALQGIKGVSMMVSFRSLSFSMVRALIIAGTLQPVPISIGIKLRPDKPKLRKIRSIKKATRDM